MRTRLLQSKTALVERVEVRDVPRELAREDYSPDFQIAFPYRGRFVWHVQGDAVTSDPNQVLFIRGGEPFRVADPQPDGFGEVIITPNPASLRDAAQATGFDLERHPLFAARRRRATPDIQFQCALLLHGIRSDAGDEFGTTELLLRLLCDALQLTPPQCRHGVTRFGYRRPAARAPARASFVCFTETLLGVALRSYVSTAG